jgi:phospholipid N-methyltransferase
MIISIHQPEAFCHLPLIDKISKSDLFVVMDEVFYEKNYYQNRNKIRSNSAEGWSWLTIPVEKHNHKAIKDIKIANGDWENKLANQLINSYGKSPYFDAYFPQFQRILNIQSDYLIDYTLPILQWLMGAFGISTPIKLMGELNIQSDNGSDKVLEICQKVGATTYLSGPSGKDYLDLSKFDIANIDVKFHNYLHPYYQSFPKGDMLPGLSALDCLFSHGPNSKNIIQAKGIDSLVSIMNDINYKHSSILEVFGGDGTGQLSSYGNSVDCSNLTIWELDLQNVYKLRDKYPHANVKHVDSLIEAKRTNQTFDIIIMDTPALMSTNKLLPQISNLLAEDGILIFRAIKQSWNNHSSVEVDHSIEYWKLIFQSNFDVMEMREVQREYFWSEGKWKWWLSNYVFQLKRI